MKPIEKQRLASVVLTHRFWRLCQGVGGGSTPINDSTPSVTDGVLKEGRFFIDGDVRWRPHRRVQAAWEPSERDEVRTRSVGDRRRRGRRALSPLIDNHINPYGVIEFNRDQRITLSA